MISMDAGKHLNDAIENIREVKVIIQRIREIYSGISETPKSKDPTINDKKDYSEYEGREVKEYLENRRKDEIYQIAKELDIPKRSKMSKDELVKAICKGR